jgi:ribonucleoside-diphosphate reductase alpha chain
MRERLPDRRASETFQLDAGVMHYTCTFSRSAAGHALEIFLSNTKPASQSDANARDSAIAASLALQYGCPLQVLQHAP